MPIIELEGTDKEAGLCKIGITGDMTIYAAEELKTALDALDKNYKDFEFNLSEVEEIDTSGVQILMVFTNHIRAKENRCSIKHSNEEVRKILGKYHLEDQLSA